MMKVHGHPCTVNSRKVLWTLEELGRAYTLHLIELAKSEQKAPGFLALNPNGRMPVIEDEGLVLYESNAILLYLCEAPGAVSLLPTERVQRAHVYQWLSWQTSDLSPAFVQPFLMRFNAIFGAPFDEAAHRKHLERTAQVLRLLDAHLAGRRFMVGPGLSLADIALAESVAMADDAGIGLTPYNHVRAWLEPLFERPAFQKTRFNGDAFVQAVPHFTAAVRGAA